MSIQKSKFQVNLEGVLRILSESLYSTPNVFIRELLQNSVDAIKARENLEKFKPQIDISFYSSDDGIQGMIFSDNGIGLNLDEVESFLSKIGASSKSVNKLMDERSSYIGQFGIGMLSCFMVCDEIIVTSRSAKPDSKSVKWIGHIDGTYESRYSDEISPIGTSVILNIRKDVEFDEDILNELLKQYASHIKVPVRLLINDLEKTVSQKLFSWEDNKDRALFLEQGLEYFGEIMEYGFDIDIPELETKGKAYILNRPTHHGETGFSRVYIKNMLITADSKEILPEWAFFVRLVINSAFINPTASREDVFQNSKLSKLKKEIEKSIKEHLNELSQKYPQTLNRIMQHHTVAFKSLATDDIEFFKLVNGLFSYETSKGRMTLSQLLEENSNLLYVTDTEEFNRILPIARANDKLIINAGYIYDASIFSILADMDESHNIQRVNSQYFGNALMDIDPDFSEKIEPSLDILQQFLDDYSCEISVKSFEPSSVPALYNLSDEARKAKDVQNIKEESDDLWSFVTDTIGNAENSSIKATLILNVKNTVVRRLIDKPENNASRIILETVLFNSMMQSNVLLSNAEQTQMNFNLNYLLENLK